MTIGKSSKRNKAPSAPPFLDKASGFYLSLKPEAELWEEVNEMVEQPATTPGVVEEQSIESSTGSGLPEEQDHGVFDIGEGLMDDDDWATLLQRKPSRWKRCWSRMSSRRTRSNKTTPETEATETEVHPSVEKKEEEEMEEKPDVQIMKSAKRSGFRSYSKAFDRALRRGWETFVANLYSVTLTSA